LKIKEPEIVLTGKILKPRLKLDCNQLSSRRCCRWWNEMEKDLDMNEVCIKQWKLNFRFWTLQWVELNLDKF
jgi:hypothetical protein